MGNYPSVSTVKKFELTSTIVLMNNHLWRQNEIHALEKLIIDNCHYM
jgi:hypothetical protein